MGRAVAVIVLASGFVAAAIGPWLLLPPRQGGARSESRPVQAEERPAPAKVARAIEAKPLPPPLSPAATIPETSAKPVTEDEAATLAPPGTAPLARNTADSVLPLPAEDVAALRPAPSAIASEAVSPDVAREVPPPVAPGPDQPPEASLATGSLAVPQVSPPPAFGTGTAREVRSRSPTPPLPRAFKPSVEREPARALPQRRAARPDRAPAFVQSRTPLAVVRPPIRRQTAFQAKPPPQAPTTRPAPVVLPNSLLPLGTN